MNCVYYGDFRVKHFNKRRLIGSQKTRALDAMCTHKVDPSVFVRNEANTLMKEGDAVPAQIPNIGTLRVAKYRAIAATRYDSNPIIAISLMKQSQKFDNSIHDIGFDKFFVHFWSHLQLQIYRNNYKKEQVPTISFDATGGCFQKLKRNEFKLSGSIFLYEGVMCINDQSFTVMSMLSEQHDNISISSWLRRWLRCGIDPPKIAICDQSLALMSAIVQAFTKYSSLEQYIDACFSLIILKEKVQVPKCFLRNDVNHFIHLVSQWSVVKNSRYPNTKDFITRGMGLLVMCTSVNKAEKILEAIFTIILSRDDGDILHVNQSNNHNERKLTPCAKSKKYLKDLIKSSDNLDNLEFEQDDSNNPNAVTKVYPYEDANICGEGPNNFFKGWAQAIANRVKIEIMGIEGSTDNAQFLPELEIVIVKTMKLFPIWSGIMINIFGYGTETASSSRIESNFNHIKNRVFKNENMPLRVDMFLEKLLYYYKGDHLLLQSQDQYQTHFECTDENNCTKREINNKFKGDNFKLSKDVIIKNLKNKSTKYCEISDDDNLESDDDEYLRDDDTNQYTHEEETEYESKENINYDDLRTKVEEHHSDCESNKYTIQKKETVSENEDKKNCDDLNAEEYDKNDDRNNECRQEKEINDEYNGNSRYGFLMLNENEYMVTTLNEKDQQNNLSKINQRKTHNTLSKHLNETTIKSLLCVPCTNGDLPSGLHKCSSCKKPIHLFGCSIAAPGTKEGCGEERICLNCDNTASEEAENEAFENWNRKGKNQNIKSKITRSARSYLVHQPGFDLVDLNKTRSSTLICILKNGNNLKNRPISVPGSEKMILNNTCTVDSLISVLASSAADSIIFRNYLEEIEPSNLTAKLALQLIIQKNTKQIYHTRLSLLLQFFGDKTEALVGGIKCLDITDTVGSMVDKILKEMPSFTTYSKCQNNFCPVPHLQHNSAKLSLNVYNEKVCVQTEVEKYIKNTKALCEYCGNERHSVIKTTSHIIVELNSIPKSLENSTSMTDIESVPLDLIHQNFAKSYKSDLQSIEKHIILKEKMYKLRGVINFHGSERSGLRCAVGHYTACSYRSNKKWELYDDTKMKIQNINPSKKLDIEILIFTI
ncbi:unnamed protein product [Macrosiphum euphorbiae]|uniref:SCAN domain-containing protein n=1 Tax=Macrosiphum euphorbiae TaxID=13131 RepID=A0AAV0Y3Y6_9HEMI|nr:unnamed protein product [Macrosiphum euphorbiae]